MVDCFVGMGGNQNFTLNGMRDAVARLIKTEGITSVQVSNLYQTTPVSAIKQPDYLNAVCRFTTSLSLQSLWDTLQCIEKTIGKIPKSKDAPRLIDLDLLFYGAWVGETNGLITPHPRWHERLFVLVPLADVTDIVPIEGGLCMQEILKRFTNPHKEKVVKLNERLNETNQN